MNKHPKRRLLVPWMFVLTSSVVISILESPVKATYKIENGNAASATVDVRSAVCYYTLSSNKYYFGTIEDGLAAAAKATSDAITVFVIPGRTVEIKNDCEIASNVTLTLPYDGETYQQGTDDEWGYEWLSKNGDFADSSETSVNTYRKLLVKVAKGVTITNNGTLKIGGHLGWGQGSSNESMYPAAYTNGNYAELNLDGNAIIQNSGIIYCPGYIKENNLNNGSAVINSKGSKVYLPFVIYDYKGGRFTKSAVVDQKVFPIQIFDFPNCQVQNKFRYGSSLFGRGGINQKANFIPTGNIPCVGSGSGFFRFAKDDDTEMTIKYNGQKKFPYTFNDCANINTAKEHLAITKLYIKGNFELASTSMKIYNYTIDSSDYYFPVSYKFDIALLEGTTCTITKKVKFLYGQQFLIKEGATLNINSNVVFYRDFIEDLTGVAKHIPTSAGPSSLVNNGTMNLTSAFGGYINNAASGAIIKTRSNFSNSVTSEEMYGGQSTDSYGQHFTMTVPAVAKIGSKADDATDAQLKGSSNYTGENGWWKGVSGGSTIKESRGDTAESSCVLPGTLITMADGSTKPIEDVHGRDMVLVFNHGTGRYDVAPVMFNDPEPIKQVKVIRCEFDDGTTLGIIDEHGLFDMDLNQYVYITEETMSNYVGHHFFSNQNSLDFNQHRIVTLKRVYIQEEMTACYSITTAKHFNYFTNGLLGLSGGIAGMFNYFDLDADMKVDLVKMKRDIEKYGLFAYDDFKAYLTEEEFDAYNGKYLKVALGKGLLTKRKLEQLIARYGGKAT